MSGLRLILARHAHSVANAAGVLDTALPGGPLDEVGRAQAADLAARLDDEPLVAVYASRARRAQQTARPIAVRRALAVHTLSGVHEVSVGDLEGRRGVEDHAELHALYRAWYGGDLDAARPGGESAKQVLRRYLADVAALRAEHRQGTVVLVSHGAATRLAVVALATNVDGAFAGPRPLSNTGTVLLEPDGVGWRCRHWDGIDLG